MRLRLPIGLHGGGVPAFIGPGKVPHRGRHIAPGLCRQLPERLHPFWSCEGHIGPAGKVTRLPRVWFYARSVLYPRLITEYAANCT